VLPAPTNCSATERAARKVVEELGAHAVVVDELAEGGAGRSGSSVLLNAAHDHAHVHALNHNDDTDWVEDGLDSVANLLAEALLDLEAARVHVNDARELAEADDVVTRKVCHVSFADEGHHVVFAHGVDVNVADDDHFAVGFAEDGAIDEVLQFLRVAGGEEAERFGDAHGGLLKTFAVGVLPNRLQNSAHASGHGLQAFFGLTLFNLGVGELISEHVADLGSSVALFLVGGASFERWFADHFDRRGEDSGGSGEREMWESLTKNCWINLGACIRTLVV